MPTDATPTGQGPPHVRARRADRHRHLLRGAERGLPGPRHAQLLGRILRGPGRAAGAGTGRGGARGLLQLRRRRGGAPHPVGLGEDQPGGGDRRARAGQRRRAAADDRGARRLPRSGVGVADLATRAAVSAPTEGRALYAGLRALDVPEEPVARLWHAATLLREHRGDGHNAALVAHGIGGTEAHVLLALSLGIRAEEFGRIHHLPKAQLAAVADGLRGRGLVDAAGGLTDAGRETRERIEALTDELAAPAYDVLSADELDELIAGLDPIAAAVQAAGD